MERARSRHRRPRALEKGNPVRLRRPRTIALAAVMATMAALAVPAANVSAASAAPATHPASQTRATIPLPVYAPYFETYLPSSISAVAKESLSAGHYLSEIATLRKMGGDVIPSFGGFSADQGGTEIADSCTSVTKIAAAYELLITKYHVTRLDMDVEAKSLGRKAGINRRDEAIAMAQAWAAKHGTRLQVDFTLPVEPNGLQGPGLAVVRNAIADGVHVGVVNIMTFDYYQTHEGVVDMPVAAMSAAMNLHNQLAGLYPKLTGRQLWAMEGMTLLPGIDDRGKIETTYLHGTAEVMAFAQHEHMSLLSIWAIQRDNGGCPGKTDSNTCSGIKQGPWAFSHLLEHFTG